MFNDAVGKVKSFQSQKDAVTNNLKPLQNQLSDLSEVKKQLFESLIKEMKNISKKNFNKITMYSKVNSTDIVVTFLLDSITKFLSGDAKATFIG